MWLTVLFTALSLSYAPLPEIDTVSTVVNKTIQAYLPKPQVRLHAKSHLNKYHFIRMFRQIARHAKAELAGKKTHRRTPAMAREGYAKRYTSELVRMGKPDEAAFLIAVVREESNWNPKAVSYLPPKRMKNKKMSPPLWHCGLVQHQCLSYEGCLRFQQDPSYAAKEDLKKLQYLDRWRGHKDASRHCNWQHGPGHDKCRKIRHDTTPTS